MITFPKEAQPLPHLHHPRVLPLLEATGCTIHSMAYMTWDPLSGVNPMPGTILLGDSRRPIGLWPAHPHQQLSEAPRTHTFGERSLAHSPDHSHYCCPRHPPRPHDRSYRFIRPLGNQVCSSEALHTQTPGLWLVLTLLLVGSLAVVPLSPGLPLLWKVHLSLPGISLVPSSFIKMVASTA